MTISNPVTKASSSSASARLIAMICFAMLAFAANSLLCRLALKHTDIDAASFSVVRLASGALVLWLLCALRRTSTIGKGSWQGAAALFVYVFAFSFAYRHLETGTGALLLFGAVQLSMVLYGMFKGERMRTRAIVGFVLALAGLVSLLLPGAASPDALSALTMLLSGLAWGIYSLFGKGGVDPLATTAGNFIRSIPLVLIASLPFLSGLHWDSLGMLYALLSGALASGVGYAVWYIAVRDLAAFQAATVQLSVPILASLAGIVLLDESLSLRMVLASVGVLGGVALVLGSKQRA
ncbi:Membrane protein [Pseudomonas syringae pv. maculicola]|uniref:DMT family transporter n=1 Tax=Pseudomonas TaxID=286 RepID=UPI0006B9A4D2|nr:MULTISPECIES: DMT family transporter [Pseudomonas]MBM0211799.1 DMT family transporter [Pseudomonas syringae pv. maculicola]RMM74736.1 Membrane protein [Pseudomonas syringae pv. maculicola]SIR90822.1 Threonine/homoserine efflux transporter RhtA [Pseudomonas sp. A214]